MSATGSTTLELDSAENQRLLRRECRAEQVGWLLMTAVIVAALAGALADGPLAWRLRASPDGRVQVQYDGLARYEAPSELVVRFQASSTEVDSVRLFLSRSWTDHTTIESVTPRPVTEELAEDGIIHVFKSSDVLRHGSILYRYKHDAFGTLEMTLGIDGSRRLRIRQFVFP